MLRIANYLLLTVRLLRLIGWHVEDIHLEVVGLRACVVCRSRIYEMHKREVRELGEVYVIGRAEGKRLHEEVRIREYLKPFDYVIERDHVRACLLNS